MVVGVGGQGVIVAAAVIADTAMLHGGLDVKLSETRGMSQRGGSVSSHIRIGERVVAPEHQPRRGRLPARLRDGGGPARARRR